MTVWQDIPIPACFEVTRKSKRVLQMKLTQEHWSKSEFYCAFFTTKKYLHCALFTAPWRRDQTAITYSKTEAMAEAIIERREWYLPGSGFSFCFRRGRAEVLATTLLGEIADQLAAKEFINDPT